MCLKTVVRVAAVRFFLVRGLLEERCFCLLLVGPPQSWSGDGDGDVELVLGHGVTGSWLGKS